MLKRIQKSFTDFSELVMFKHSVFALPFIFIAMLVASKHYNGTAWFGWKLLILGVLAAITARNFAMGVNRYFDRDIDKLNPRTQNRPSVDGRVNGSQIVLFTLLNGLAFIAIAYFVNGLAFWLSVPILIVLGGYTLFKRFSALAHLILGVSLGLAPIAGVVAVSAEIPLWSLLLAIGVMFWVAGFDLLYSLQDIAFDKAHGLHSIPSKFGTDKTLWIARAFHLLSVLFWGLFVAMASLGLWGALAVVFSAIMLGYEHIIVSRDFTKIDKAFFTVNGYLGFVFFILILIEVI